MPKMTQPNLDYIGKNCLFADSNCKSIVFSFFFFVIPADICLFVIRLHVPQLQKCNKRKWVASTVICTALV